MNAFLTTRIPTLQHVKMLLLWMIFLFSGISSAMADGNSQVKKLEFSNVTPAVGSVISGFVPDETVTFNTNMDDEIGYMTMVMKDDQGNMLKSLTIIYDPNLQNPNTGKVWTESPVTHKDPHFTWTSPSTWKYEQGHTYYLEMTAYESKENWVNNKVLAEGAIVYKGSLTPFVPSAAKLVSVTPNLNNFIIKSLEQSSVTLTFSDKVNINNDLAFISLNEYASYKFDSLVPGEDKEAVVEHTVDGKDSTVFYSTQWTLTPPKKALVEGQDVSCCVAAIDKEGKRVCDGIYSTGLGETDRNDFTIMNDYGREMVELSPNEDAGINSLYSFVVSADGVGITGGLTDAVLYKKGSDKPVAKINLSAVTKSSKTGNPSEMLLMLDHVVTEAGTYVLHFPRSYFFFGEVILGYFSPQKDYEFTIEKTTANQLYEITPKEDVNELKVINVKFLNRSDVGVDYYHSTAYLFDEKNELVTTGDIESVWSDDPSVFTSDNANVTLKKAVSTPGKYTLVIRDGAFNLGALEGETEGEEGDYGEGGDYIASLPIIHQFNVVAGKSGDVKLSVDPADGSILPSLKSITLTFDGAYNVQCAGTTLFIDVTNKRNRAMVLTETDGDKATVSPTIDMWDPKEMTAEDTYTFNFPTGYFKVNGQDWPAFSLTYQIKKNATGISEVNSASDIDVVKVYNLQGIKVAEGNIVETLQGLHGVYIINDKKVTFK